MLYLSASFYNKSRQSINETCKFVGTILNKAMIDFKNGIRWEDLSELDAAKDFPDYDAQKSFING